MAESIFVTLRNGRTETSVPAMGKDEDGNTVKVSHQLPKKLFPDDETFGDETKLIAWANENTVTFPLLQMGLQSGLIDVRAKFKSVGKKDVWTPEYGQANVDAMEWKPVKRPAGTISKKDKAANALAALSPEELADVLAKLKGE